MEAVGYMLSRKNNRGNEDKTSKKTTLSESEKNVRNRAGAAVRQRAEPPCCSQLCMGIFLHNVWSSANSIVLHWPEGCLQDGGDRHRASSSTNAGEGESVL